MKIASAYQAIITYGMRDNEDNDINKKRQYNILPSKNNILFKNYLACLLICLASLDFVLAALFLGIIPFVAALSRVCVVFLNSANASAFSLEESIFLTEVFIKTFTFLFFI